MPIISKESFNKLTQEEKEKLRELYSDSVKVDFAVMRKIFGEEALQPKPLTYEDVVEELFDGEDTFYISDIGSIVLAEGGRWVGDKYKLPNNCTSRKQAEKLCIMKEGGLMSPQLPHQGQWYAITEFALKRMIKNLMNCFSVRLQIVTLKQNFIKPFLNQENNS